MQQEGKALSELKQSQGKLKEDLAMLQTLEGFRALSPNQQLLINTSLVINERAFRTTDHWSSLAITERKSERMIRQPHFGGLPVRRRYEEEQDLLMRHICFDTAFLLDMANYLTQAQIIDELKKPLRDAMPPPTYFLDGFTSTEYSPEKRLVSSEVTVPSVLLISGTYLIADQQRNGPLHACILLGTSPSGEMMVWEKNGLGGEYRLNTLSAVMKQYDTGSSNLSLSWRGLRGSVDRH